MKSQEVSAKTIEEAISLGLEQLGASISDVTVDILEEGSKGLFGLFGSRPAKVRLTLKEEEPEDSLARDIFAGTLEEKPAPKPAPKAAPQPKQEKPAQPAVKPQAPKAPKPVLMEEAPKAEQPAPEKQEKAEKPAPKPRKPREPREPKEAREVKEPKEIVPAEQADRATAAGRAQEFLQQLTELMGVHVSVAVATDEEGNVRVNMEGDTLGILIGRRGETLDALQYLTSLLVNKGQNNYTRVTLDTEGYRAKREEALVRLANRMANRCQKTGRKVSLEPMNPYERRILHSALQDHPAVTTHSEGEEPNRHVVITLKTEK
ncbi:MAG: RNA-binding cell elongation regulator Jag/EloR [Eubacteriales bacterium]|nr:RNA-binding cell elongation regulator Jag/EloR [Eubacteriales bacterium]